VVISLPLFVEREIGTYNRGDEVHGAVVQVVDNIDLKLIALIAGDEFTRDGSTSSDDPVRDI
jgi:hypothetical protein